MDIMLFLEKMGASDISIAAAFFIGLMAAISPCPLATNITAVAYMSRRIENSKHTLLVSLLYTLGRAFTYVGLASLIVYIGLNTQRIALLLQAYGEKLLGPLLIVIGLVMTEIIRFDSVGDGNKLDALKQKLTDKGYLGAFLLGVVFALAFCPFSAVLYFGMLIPLALRTNDALLVPLAYAMATGLPVILASVLLVKSVSTLGQVMDKVQVFEKVMRRSVGVVFTLVGIYYIFVTWS